MENFITIGTERFRKTTIKRYRPLESFKLIIYFNSSRYKVESQTFEFSSYAEREMVLNSLDKVL